MKTLLAATAMTLLAGASFAQENPMVGGAEMPATNDIVANAVNSADHTTLVAAVQAAGPCGGGAGRDRSMDIRLRGLITDW